MSKKIDTEEIEWGDPPEPGTGRKGVWVVRLAPFRARPGEWGRLPGLWDVNSATRIKRGKMHGVERSEFEAVLRGIVDGKGVLWVRYIGGEQ